MQIKVVKRCTMRIFWPLLEWGRGLGACMSLLEQGLSVFFRIFWNVSRYFFQFCMVKIAKMIQKRQSVLHANHRAQLGIKIATREGKPRQRIIIGSDVLWAAWPKFLGVVFCDVWSGEFLGGTILNWIYALMIFLWVNFNSNTHSQCFKDFNFGVSLIPEPLILDPLMSCYR